MTRRGPFEDYVLKDAPTADDVAAVLDPLRRLLRREMRRRDVWVQGPSHWGYAGRSWREEEVFNDLLSDCFASVFDGEKGKRLIRLRQYARHQPSIAGTVRTAVRNFLNEQERQKDPVGHAVFKNIQAAVVEALDVGEMKVVDGKPSDVTNGTVVVTNSTVVVTNSTVVASASGEGCTKAPPMDLRVAINGWADGASLCGQMAKRSGRGLRAAAEVLSRLSEARPNSWRVGDLVDAVKQALPRREDGAFPEVAPTVPGREPPPTRPVEDEEVVGFKSERTRAAIEGLPCQRKVKDRLLRLWTSMIKWYRENGSFPKQAEAVEMMDLPRQGVSADYARLRPLLVKIWELDPG
jgi:hypothetical protein